MLIFPLRFHWNYKYLFGAIMITSLHFKITTNPEIIEMINELAELEKRKPHDTAKRLLLEAGKNKIELLKPIRENSNPSVKKDGDILTTIKT